MKLIKSKAEEGTIIKSSDHWALFSNSMVSMGKIMEYLIIVERPSAVLSLSLSSVFFALSSADSVLFRNIALL